MSYMPRLLRGTWSSSHYGGLEKKLKSRVSKSKGAWGGGGLIDALKKEDLNLGGA